MAQYIYCEPLQNNFTGLCHNKENIGQMVNVNLITLCIQYFKVFEIKKRKNFGIPRQGYFLYLNFQSKKEREILYSSLNAEAL